MGTIPTIATHPSGGEVTAAYLNTIKTAYDFLKEPPGAYVYQGTVTSIANNASVGTVCAFDSEIYDSVQSGDSPMHNTTTNNHRVYIRTAGKYELSGQVQFAANATGLRVARIIVNSGGSYSGGTLAYEAAVDPPSSGVTSTGCIPVKVSLSVGDYVELWGLQSSGSALNTVVGQGKTFLRVDLTGS